MTSPDMPARIQRRRVGSYELLLRLGTGGMATVYLARRRVAGGLDRWLAVKVMHPFVNETDRRQLFDEARVAMAIRHPNVVPTFEALDDESGACLVMEYVEGDTLLGLLKRPKGAEGVPRPVALRILADALAGLHAAHELVDQGVPVHVVHRDFTPSNVLVGTDGVGRLTDFGVAKATNRESRTRTGDVKGKLGYLSPEQIEERPVDRRSDVFAAGVVAWEALSGKRLHGGSDAVGVMMRIVNQDAPRLRSVCPEMPQGLDDVVAWALDRDVERRCPDADTLRRALLDAAAPLGGPADISEVARFVSARTAERRAVIQEVMAASVVAGEPGEAAPVTGPVAVPAPVAAASGSGPAASNEPAAPGSAAAARAGSSPVPWRRAQVAIGAAVVAALVAGAYAFVRAGAEEPLAGGAPAAVSPSAAAPAETAPPAASQGGPASPGGPAAPAAAVLVRAAFPMTSLRVGSRDVVLPAPSQEVELNLTEAERSGDLVLVARGADGSTGTATLHPPARSVEIRRAAEPPRPRKVKVKDDPLAPPPPFKR